METIQEIRIFALLLEMLDQRFGVALYLGVNQANVDVFFQKVVGKALYSFRRDFERLAEITLQRVDAAAASVKMALHQAAKRF